MDDSLSCLVLFGHQVVGVVVEWIFEGCCAYNFQLFANRAMLLRDLEILV